MVDSLFSVADQVVLVSGGSRGIGRAIAAGFAERGAQVVITGRNQDTIEKTADELSDTSATKPVVGLVSDVAQCEGMPDLVADVVERYERIDTLVNVAGINKRQAAVKYSEQEYDDILDVNLKGAFFLSQEVGKQMLRQGSGSQINIGSLNSHRPLTNIMPYAISKAGIDHMTRGLAAEWGPHGIRVNCIGPGFVLTDLVRKLWENKEMSDWRESHTPQRRIGTPEDMVGTTIFLASDASAYLTGQVIYVDGGVSAAQLWPIPAS